MRRTFLVVASSIFLAFVVACGSGRPGAEPRTSEQVAEDAADQTKRKELLDGFRNDGFIDKIDGEKVAQLWVKERFASLPFDRKKTLANLAFVWFYNVPKGANVETIPGDQLLRIVDWKNGKTVGTYSPSSGLDLEK